MIRLNKFIANCGIASRRKADILIQEGNIKVNGITITELGFTVSDKDIVTYNDRQITEEKSKIYILLNKPANIISTTSDPKHRPTVLDIIDKKYSKYRLYPIGRLDFNTTGLLLLTNDGKLTYKLSHPKHEIDKEYQVRIKPMFNINNVKTLMKGIKVKDYFVKPRSVEIIENNKEYNTSLIKIVISEGKNHEVRDIFKQLKFEVIRLTRTRLAFLDLKDLKKGDYRELKIHEIKKLYSM